MEGTFLDFPFYKTAVLVFLAFSIRNCKFEYNFIATAKTFKFFFNIFFCFLVILINNKYLIINL